MTINRAASIAVVLTLGAWSSAAGAQHPAMPPGTSHEEHLAQMQRDADLKRRGAVAMGFDQDAAVHHFLLTTEGGVIRVDATNPTDGVTLLAIREHLRGIASAFANGTFDAPSATHAETPPGVPALQRLKEHVTYVFEETLSGGLVRIQTSNHDALSAVHEFLRYQITAHRTGDSMTLTKAPR